MFGIMSRFFLSPNFSSSIFLVTEKLNEASVLEGLCKEQWDKLPPEMRANLVTNCKKCLTAANKGSPTKYYIMFISWL